MLRLRPLLVVGVDAVFDSLSSNPYCAFQLAVSESGFDGNFRIENLNYYLFFSSVMLCYWQFTACKGRFSSQSRRIRDVFD